MMNHEERQKALREIIRSMREESLADCREQLACAEAERNKYSIAYYRKAVAELEARLDMSDLPQVA